MKNITIAALMSMSLLSACAEMPIASANPNSIGSANSASSAGEYGWLWAILGAGVLYYAVNNGNSGSGHSY